MYQSVLQFWFEELTPAQWWHKDAALDTAIAERFGGLHERACRGELFEWRSRAPGRLAEIIVLDQFSRNIHRGRPASFAADGMALALTQEAISQDAERALSREQRLFLYMPFMHSESLKIHDQALILFERLGLADNLDFEHRHRNIIERFGRYPHRNAILGRPSTPEEQAFLKQPGSGF
ncbi:hypothetical protein GU3_11575 [Oceanimonas sp. GK1]|uniref:DUF924 family protein n=1 Tax=Oceanimonas sp. (strain GK1 / IBRC-M 10197) TaxID=511062 RepID=UPI0002495653|nr:DUF924 family protein [Oceanimonas sp. GK1]AEY02070.1 hypothetical protein GU3_11575 [Oceanimonas sp. GK1]